MRNEWYVIYNPSSGPVNSRKNLDSLKELFAYTELKAEIELTKYSRHEEVLVQDAIKNGFRKFICVGGDGTLHYMVNGIMHQQITAPSSVTLAMIPTGTGNDWAKTYKIPKDPAKAVALIKKNKTLLQDIGCIKLINEDKTRYFNNVAGLGFDAYVVKKLPAFKKFGSLSYLLTGLMGFFNYKSSQIEFVAGKLHLKETIFMLVVGIGKYSGGGIQLTDYKRHRQGLFDITLVPKISFSTLILNLYKLYNGRIERVKGIRCFKNEHIRILSNDKAYIQADGELIGKGTADLSLEPEAIRIIIP